MKNNNNYTTEEYIRIREYIRGRDYLDKKIGEVRAWAKEHGVDECKTGHRVLSIHGAEHVAQIDGQVIARWISFVTEDKVEHQISVFLENDPNWNLSITLTSSVTNAKTEICTATDQENLDAAATTIKNAFVGILEGIQNGWLSADKRHRSG